MAEVAKRDYEETRVDLGLKGQEFVPNPGSLVSRISRLIRSQLVRVATGLILAAGGAGTALSACTSADTDTPNKPAGTYGTQTGALNLTQVSNIGPGQPVPWGVKAAAVPSYAEINGGKHLFFPLGAKGGGVGYIKCQAIKDCLSADANIQAVQGLVAAGLPYKTVQWQGEEPYDKVIAGTSGVFQDAEGNNKLLVVSDWPVYKCDIAPNADAVLKAANCAKLDPPMTEDFSIFKKSSGGFYALWNKGFWPQRRNLQTGKDTKLTDLNIDWTNSCGIGFEGDMDPLTYKQLGVVGAVRIPTSIDKIYCYLATAENWKKFNDSPIPLTVLNEGSNHVEYPRLADNYILYLRDYKLWYAKIPEAPQNPEPDTGDASDTEAPDTDQPDTTQPEEDTVVIDQPDTTDEAETNQLETTDQEDISPETDNNDTQPDPGDIANDIADDVDTTAADTDTTPDTPSDTPPDPDDITDDIDTTATDTDTTPDIPLPLDAQSEIEIQSDSDDLAVETDQDSDQDSTPDTSIPPDFPPDIQLKTDIQARSDTASNSEPEFESNSDYAPDTSQNEADFKPETAPGQDTSISNPSTPPKNPDNKDSGGCQTGSNSPSSSLGTTASMLATMALLATRRRQKEL